MVPSTCRIFTPQERALVRRLLGLPLPPPLLLPWKDEAESGRSRRGAASGPEHYGDSCPGSWELWTQPSMWAGHIWTGWIAGLLLTRKEHRRVRELLVGRACEKAHGQ